MTSNTDHPFQRGTLVAIRTTTGNSWSLWEPGTVDKVYKTGKFTLVGNTQQWRPSRDSLGGRDCAHKTGTSRYDRKTLYLLADVKDEMKEDRATQKRSRRFYELRDRIQRLPFGQTTDAMLDAIEAALPPVPEDKA